MTSELSRIQNTTSIRPDIPKKNLAAVQRMSSRTTNIFSIIPTMMPRQARRWQPRAHTITKNIPDELFERPYLIRVRDYAKPVNKIKLVIKGVHRGTQFRDTCISLIKLRAPLSKKPEIQAAR